MSKKTVYQYQLSDGRTVISPVGLDYALNYNARYLLLDKLTANDAKHISVLADSDMALMVSMAMDSGTWEDPNYLMASASRVQISYPRNFCILQNGKIFVNDGKYIELNKFLAKADNEEKELLIRQLALQAALAQLEMVAQNSVPAAV